MFRYPKSPNTFPCSISSKILEDEPHQNRECKPLSGETWVWQTGGLLHERVTVVPQAQRATSSTHPEGGVGLSIQTCLCGIILRILARRRECPDKQNSKLFLDQSCLGQMLVELLFFQRCPEIVSTPCECSGHGAEKQGKTKTNTESPPPCECISTMANATALSDALIIPTHFPWKQPLWIAGPTLSSRTASRSWSPGRFPL